MKKGKIIVGLILIGCLIYMIVPIKYTYLYAKSEDGKWIAYGFPAYKNGEWAGDMFYQGNSNGNIGNIKINIKYNGKNNYYKGDISPDNYYKAPTYIANNIIKNQKEYIYAMWEFGGYNIPEAVIKVNWIERKEKRATIIVMRKKSIYRSRIMGSIWDK